mgnify:CR=1 FL=1
MGCDAPLLLPSEYVGCFNPRTHMGCDYCIAVRCFLSDVSIHAPTWGATFLCDLVAVELRVSIHAPTWGATNLRHIVTMHTDVSIHAPTWGATTNFIFADILRIVSIHAPTWGATHFGIHHA